MSRDINLIIHNVRSSHNVGSLLRTAEGLGVNKVYISGYSPYPEYVGDKRLPHIRKRVERQINKTSLGAERLQNWERTEDIVSLIDQLKNEGWLIAGLEQDKKSIKLPKFNPSVKTAILIGNEVSGIDEFLLKSCDKIVEIPMFGDKESFNVVQASAMAMYHCRFFTK